ncbi:MAG: hypothetical protein M5U22_11280 [Thermoleophilia bacterium]|nr:hypothetical protein [Thermoleophilia bacterium]
MKRPVFLTVAFLLFAALAALVVFLSTNGGANATNDAQMQRLQTKLDGLGVSVSSIKVDGERVQVDMTVSGEYGIEDEVAKWRVYRAAAEEGFTWLELHTNGSEGREGYSLRLDDVPHADPAIASQEIAAWVADVEQKTGVKANATYRDYRLDLVVDGSPEAAPAAAERLMMGGSVQHDAGNLDVLTIVIRSNGETVFKGVGDYVVGAQTRLYQAPDLSFDW